MKPEIFLELNMTAAELCTLAAYSDTQVQAAVAQHPNTPLHILESLAATFPVQVLSNPALPLLRLAQPQVLRQWSTQALLGLLSQPKPPSWLRQIVLNAKQIELPVAFASHPDLSAAEAGQLAAHAAWLVRARIAARLDLSAELLSLLTTDSAYGVRLALAYRLDLPQEAGEVLSHDPSRFVRQALKQRSTA